MMTPDLAALKTRIVAIIAPVAGPKSEEEARWILERAQVPADPDGATIALAWAEKRAQGAPLALVTGWQRFLGIDLLARREVLAPREETELLGREALALLRALETVDPARALRVIDMGCGSGNLCCALAIAVPRLQVWASDLEESCAALTRENISLHGLQARIQVTRGDLFGPLGDHGLEGSIDLVVMNPPYLPTGSLEQAHADLLRHEPRAAFDGGPYGISILNRLIQEAPRFLKPGGHLLFEFGQGQGEIVRSLVERKGIYSGIQFVRDAAGQARVAVLKTPTPPEATP